MIKTTPRRRGGFTIVELLVTIGIILVLLGILLPTILAVRRTADRKRTEADLQTITQALEAYKQVFNDYPRQIRPDWNTTQPGRLSNDPSTNPPVPYGPERVLAKYLIGWDPVTHTIDDQGVRVVKVVTDEGKKASNNAKKWGPYLPPDRFKVDTRSVGNIDSASNTSAGGKLLDRYGTEIQYYPKWNARTNLSLSGSIVGTVARPAAPTTPRAFYNLYDGLAFNGNHPTDQGTAHLDHLLYMLGDGPDLATGNPPAAIHPQQGGSTSPGAGFPDNRIDGASGESISNTPEFILVSAGPDKVWGLSELYDPTNTNKGGANRKRSKVDDVYNISR